MNANELSPFMKKFLRIWLCSAAMYFVVLVVLQILEKIFKVDLPFTLSMVVWFPPVVYFVKYYDKAKEKQFEWVPILGYEYWKTVILSIVVIIGIFGWLTMSLMIGRSSK